MVGDLQSLLGPGPSSLGVCAIFITEVSGTRSVLAMRRIGDRAGHRSRGLGQRAAIQQGERRRGSLDEARAHRCLGAPSSKGTARARDMAALAG